MSTRTRMTIQPDVAFVRAERLVGIDPRQRLEGAPGLAVEVASPSDDRTTLCSRHNSTSAAGARAVWVIYPEARLADTCTKLGQRPEVRATAASPSMPNSFLASLRHRPPSWDNRGIL